MIGGKRVPASAEPGRGHGKGGPRDSGGGQRFRGMPQPYAFESGVVVARIPEKRNGGGAEVAHEPSLREDEKRAHERYAVPFGDGGHSREPIDPASAPQPHEKRFGLIILGMSRGNAGRTA